MTNKWVDDVIKMELRRRGNNAKIERFNMMLEELDEFLESNTPWDELDALIDLIWFAIGTAVQKNYPIAEAWDLVARANHAKITGTTKRGMMVDFKKPEGWIAPDLRKLFAWSRAAYERGGCKFCELLVDGACTYDPDDCCAAPPCEGKR